jgi:LAO/AO transport system kinase
MGSDQLRLFFEAARGGDSLALAKLLSQLEERGVDAMRSLPELLLGDKAVFRIGITGPPGAGKSTLIGALIGELRKRGLRLGILAVDPSSPFTRGAILGDRIRYSEHFLDEKVFIRSLGTRGSLGGLSSSAYLMLRAFDHMPFDVVLIETVGVGQTELEVVNVADEVAVVLVPESGDSIQAMKAGLNEIASLFVVNKADRPGADALVHEISASQEKPVFKTVASQGQGVAELCEALLQAKSSDFAVKRASPERLQQEALALIRGEWERNLQSRVAGIKTPGDLRDLLFQK